MSDETIKPEEPGTSGRGSPVPGCLILAAIVTVFGGLVLLYTVVGIYQHRAIGEFTQDEPASISIEAPSPTAVEAAKAKLALVGAACAEGRAERVLFSAADLNALIVSMEAAAGFRENTRIEEITAAGLVAAMAQPLRKGVFKKGFRYLNADFVLQPELRARTIAFRVVAIRPAVGEVPQPFVDSYASLDLFRLDPDLSAMAENVASLAAVYTEPGQLVVETREHVGEAR